MAGQILFNSLTLYWFCGWESDGR